MKRTFWASNLEYMVSITESSSKHKWFCFLKCQINNSLVWKVSQNLPHLWLGFSSNLIESISKTVRRLWLSFMLAKEITITHILVLISFRSIQNRHGQMHTASGWSWHVSFYFTVRCWTIFIFSGTVKVFFRDLCLDQKRVCFCECVETVKTIIVSHFFID